MGIDAEVNLCSYLATRKITTTAAINIEIKNGITAIHQEAVLFEENLDAFIRAVGRDNVKIRLFGLSKRFSNSFKLVKDSRTMEAQSTSDSVCIRKRSFTVRTLNASIAVVPGGG